MRSPASSAGTSWRSAALLAKRIDRKWMPRNCLSISIASGPLMKPLVIPSATSYSLRLGVDSSWLADLMLLVACTGITLQEAGLIGSAVTAVLAMPFNIQGRSFRLTASVGASHSDQAGKIDLQAAADSAMHVAKRRGGNQVVAFQGSMHEERRNQIELEQHLHAALEQENQLSLVYQPVVKVGDWSLVAAEALARWTHPELGPIPPDRFIQLAENTGLIVPLGLKLMENAVAQAATWRDEHGEAAPRINLNISPLQFASGDVIADLKRMLDRHNLTTRAISIELIPSASMLDSWGASPSCRITILWARAADSPWWRVE
jgi:predicted signal transduction protein with EAL and GGDEF domain